MRTSSPSAASTIAASHPQLRTKSDSHSMMMVSVGSFCLVLANTLTTCGTTYDSRKITMAKATTVTMAG